MFFPVLTSLFSTNDILHYQLDFSQGMSYQPTKDLLRFFMKTAGDTSNKFSPLPKSDSLNKSRNCTTHIQPGDNAAAMDTQVFLLLLLLLRISCLGTLSFQYYNGSCTLRVFVHEISYLISLVSTEQCMVLFHQQKETLRLGMCFTQELLSSWIVGLLLPDFQPSIRTHTGYYKAEDMMCYPQTRYQNNRGNVPSSLGEHGQLFGRGLSPLL